MYGENIKADKELPPFALGDACPTNTFKGKIKDLTHAHGGVFFNMETPPVEVNIIVINRDSDTHTQP